MILSGKEIKRKLGNEIVIEPFNDRQLGPNSYNLRLHDELIVYEDAVLDMKKSMQCKK
jgi:dCTP deaminase